MEYHGPYVTAHEQRAVVVRVFIKDTENAASRNQISLRTSPGGRTMSKTIHAQKLFKEWRKEPEYIKEFEELRRSLL